MLTTATGLAMAFVVLGTGLGALVGYFAGLVVEELRPASLTVAVPV